MDNWFIDYHHALLLRLLATMLLTGVTAGLCVIGYGLWRGGRGLIQRLPSVAEFDRDYACHPVRNERATHATPRVR